MHWFGLVSDKGDVRRGKLQDQEIHYGWRLNMKGMMGNAFSSFKDGLALQICTQLQVCNFGVGVV